ncbi:hypothetical protein LQV63_14955 [Paenibacillus profundus]|uniref:Uncharacterized protein n=1 Tax=Paenibacillus profundus TaxID=1173085 RepID=A0ABS8YF29_9BACL|nr:hypothetical protein [Paenibacillus profundus]
MFLFLNEEDKNLIPIKQALEAILDELSSSPCDQGPFEKNLFKNWRR